MRKPYESWPGADGKREPKPGRLGIDLRTHPRCKHGLLEGTCSICKGLPQEGTRGMEEFAGIQGSMGAYLANPRPAEGPMDLGHAFGYRGYQVPIRSVAVEEAALRFQVCSPLRSMRA